MPVAYNSNLITPAPFINIIKIYERSQDGTIVGKVYNLVVKGKTLAYMGSPNSSKQWDTTGTGLADENIPAVSRLGALLRKQEALRALFSQEGLLFEIMPLDGTRAISCNPRIISLEFSEGPWFNDFNWTLTLQADTLAGLGSDEDASLDNYHISSASNEWALEPADEIGRTYRVQHTISAVGKRFYDVNGSLTQPAWENAKDYVLDAVGLGLDTAQMTSSGVVNGTGLTAYNLLRSQHVNELAGSFSATETWLATDISIQPDVISLNIPAIEELNANIVVSAQEGNITRCSLEGVIKGLQTNDNTSGTITSSRITNALLKYTFIKDFLYARANNLSGIILNPIPLSTQFSENIMQGVINYGAVYDNRGSNLVPGALTETISVNVEGAADVFAAIPVLGRAVGPILQSIGTVTPKTLAVSIEAVLIATTQETTAVEPFTDDIVLSFAPADAFLASDVISWSPRTGRYGRQTRYVYE